MDLHDGAELGALVVGHGQLDANANRRVDGGDGERQVEGGLIAVGQRATSAREAVACVLQVLGQVVWHNRATDPGAHARSQCLGYAAGTEVNLDVGVLALSDRASGQRGIASQDAQTQWWRRSASVRACWLCV